MPDNPPLIGIGGSSGALRPLTDILSRLPADFAGGILVTLHRHETSDSYLARLLSNKCRLRVRQTEKDETIEPGTVYVAPPDAHLLLEEGRIRLSMGPRENHSRPSIDVLFRSLAVDAGARAVGVLLSGLLNDGVAGLHAITRCGGSTIVQDPADAEFPDMPAAALKTLTVTHCLAASKIGGLLGRLARDIPKDALPCDAPPELKAEVAIALGRQLSIGTEEWLGERSNITCPECGGALWEIPATPPQRYRCHTGHAMTAAVLANSQAEKVEEAMWAAMRLLREQAETLRRLAGRADSPAEREQFEKKAKEADGHANAVADGILMVGTGQSGLPALGNKAPPEH